MSGESEVEAKRCSSIRLHILGFSTAWQASWTRPVGFEIAGEEVESGSASKTNISIKIHAAQVAPAKLTDTYFRRI